MADYPFYTLPIGTSGLGEWLIRKDRRKPGKWLLVMCGPSAHRKEDIGFFDSPHEAAYAVTHFKTGRKDWDSIRNSFSAAAEQMEKSAADVLKNWERHDE